MHDTQSVVACFFRVDAAKRRKMKEEKGTEDRSFGIDRLTTSIIHKSGIKGMIKREEMMDSHGPFTPGLR